MLLQDRSGPNRLKPMPATATAMVKAIWASYFQLGSNAEADAVAKEAEAGDAEPAAKAVDEVPSSACLVSILPCWLLVPATPSSPLLSALCDAHFPP